MRVLLISGMYHVPGVAMSATFVHRQVVELARLGVEVRVVYPVPVWPGGFAWRGGGRERTITIEVDGIQIHRMPYLKPMPFSISPRIGAAFLRRRLWRQVRDVRSEFDFDLIHAVYLFPTGYAAVGVARREGLPLVTSARGSDVHRHPHRSREFARVTRRAIRGSDRLIAVSRALSEELARLAAPSMPVEVIYNGVDVDVFRPMGEKVALRRELGLPAEGPGFCCVARLVPEKGIRELVTAFSQVATSHAEAWLCLVGDGEMRTQVQAQIRAAGLGARVFLPGARPQPDIVRWLNAADVFVLASYAEGLPNVVLEAMACALPVVATDVGGIREAIGEEEAGILVPRSQEEPLAAALERMAASDALRLERGQAGLARIRERFTWSRSAHELLRVYEDVLSGRRAGRL